MNFVMPMFGSYIRYEHQSLLVASGGGWRAIVWAWSLYVIASGFWKAGSRQLSWTAHTPDGSPGHALPCGAHGSSIWHASSARQLAPATSVDFSDIADKIRRKRTARQAQRVRSRKINP